MPAPGGILGPGPEIGGPTLAVHLTPEDIAGLLEVEPDVVLHAADAVGVPVYQGQIDRVLFAEALTAAGHHLGDIAAERLLRPGDASSG